MVRNFLLSFIVIQFLFACSAPVVQRDYQGKRPRIEERKYFSGVKKKIALLPFSTFLFIVSTQLPSSQSQPRRLGGNSTLRFFLEGDTGFLARGSEDGTGISACGSEDGTGIPSCASQS